MRPPPSRFWWAFLVLAGFWLLLGAITASRDGTRFNWFVFVVFVITSGGYVLIGLGYRPRN